MQKYLVYPVFILAFLYFRSADGVPDLLFMVIYWAGLTVVCGVIVEVSLFSFAVAVVLLRRLWAWRR